jgi:AraC-like DNA-binding protein
LLCIALCPALFIRRNGLLLCFSLHLRLRACLQEIHSLNWYKVSKKRTAPERGLSAVLQYNLDLEKNSTWLRSTPGPQELAQPYYCTETGYFYALRGFTTARSNKNAFIVFYTLGGAGVVRQGGQEVRVEKGQALLMDCRSPQSYGTAPDCSRWDHLWAHVDGAGVAAIGQLMGLPTLIPVQLRESYARKCFEEIASNVQHENAPATLRTSLAVHKLLSAMAVELAESALQGSEAKPIERAMRVVGERFAEGITVDDLAAAAKVSSSYLMRLFKRQLGTSPYNYLLRYRITKARELLAETDEPVVQIAREVGFSSESNFSYRFSKMVGQSPRAYRQSSPMRQGDGSRVSSE